MQPQLIVVAGPDRGRVFPLSDGRTLLIGRSSSDEVSLNDPKVSRGHCRVSMEGGKVMLEDAGSLNGTRVNGQPVVSLVIQPGDVVQIGQTQLAYGFAGVPLEEMPPPAADFTSSPLPKLRSLKELVGNTLWYYRLESVLARGATGMIFRARDSRSERFVAVKVLAPQYVHTREQRERFVRGMRTMLPVKHEHIVRLYAAGKKGPFCWTAMELVEGQSMADAIQRIGVAGRIDWRDGFRVAVHVARALDAAYRHKIIHRNVTPTNILERRADRVVKLGDLMLAKALEGVLVRHVTQPGRLVGELPYMAPERTREGEDVDTRADVYGLGATVYALVTGRVPFQASSIPLLVGRIRNKAPDAPKKFQLSIPDLFQDAILRMLAKRPDHRYQTPEELLRDLLRIGKFCGLPEC